MGQVAPAPETNEQSLILEAINNLTESTAGRWAKTIFPFFATITLLVLVVNWTELVPGVDSIGLLHETEHGYPIEEVVPGVYTIVPAEAGESEAEGGYGIIPFVRAVTMTQVIGFRSLGGSYFLKFFNVSGLFKRPVFGAIDFAVSLLELISEISKLLSFSFRLFGNIFAGTVLLFVIGTLVPVFAQSLFLGLEFFVGVIQALVFGMLTMIFMAQAIRVMVNMKSMPVIKIGCC
jgi:F-type H+-transporting ATPase subunit a